MIKKLIRRVNFSKDGGEKLYIENSNEKTLPNENDQTAH